MTRDEAIKKIKKCLALSRSANEHEAAAALRQAQKLMVEFGLAEQDVSLADVREAKVKARSIAVNRWEAFLVKTVAEAFACDTFTSQGGGYNSAGQWVTRRDWVFVGIDTAPEVAAYALDVLLRQCVAARQAHIAKQPKTCKSITKTARGDAFALGWAYAVQSKIEAFAPAKNEPLLISYMERHHPNLSSTKMRDTAKARRIADGHVSAGYRAGQRADLHRGVGGAGEPRRLLA